MKKNSLATLMQIKLWLILALSLIYLTFLPTNLQAATTESLSLSSKLVFSKDLKNLQIPALESSDFTILIWLEAKNDTYTYAPFVQGWQSNAESQKTYLPLKLSLTSPDLSTDLEIYFPSGELKKDRFTGIVLPVYLNKFAVLVPLKFEESKKNKLNFELKAQGLLCTANTCLPYTLEHRFSVDKAQVAVLDSSSLKILQNNYQKISATSSVNSVPSLGFTPAENNDLTELTKELKPQYYQESFEVSGLGRAIIFGLLAGFILNFMPCVLPVISLKLNALTGIASLTLQENTQATELASRKKIRQFSIFFSLGILSWFIILFAILGFAGMLWGQIFQSEITVLILATILFLLALSMFDVFYLPILNVPLTESSNPAYQAFSGGLLATLLATPCSGPLLGAVLAWAVGQPLIYLALCLLSIAVGMALPFLLLAINPKLKRFLPKSGAWSLILQRLMGFLLLGTVIYLLSLLPNLQIIPSLITLLLLALAAWLLRLAKSLKLRGKILSRGFALAFILLACLPLLDRDKDLLITWQSFEVAHFSEQFGKESMLLYFTADWCINCKVLEYTSLKESTLARWQKDYKLTLVKVDLTHDNPEGTKLLQSLGSVSIPLVAVFHPGSQNEPIVFRDFFSSSQIESVLK